MVNRVLFFQTQNVSMKSKSLEELENEYWGDPDFPSHLMTECHRLRKIPINEFSVENFRIMLGQGIGIKHLLPLALDLLEANPLAEGDFYPGDLLGSVLKLPPGFWKSEKDYAIRVNVILKSMHTVPTEIEDCVLFYEQGKVQ